MEQEKRLQYMDLAKGIGVCLVILGHMPSVVPEPIRMWIFSFHMPLFFIISGYFARSVNGIQALASSIAKKFKKLILFGYLSFGLVFLLIDSILNESSMQKAMAEVKALLLGNTTRIIWFFLSLFIVEVLFVCITMIAKTLLAQSLVCVFVVVIGFILSHVGWNSYRIGSSCYAYGFYYIGYLANRYGILDSAKQKQIILAVIALLINVIGTMLFLRISSMVLDINCNMHHDIVVNYAIALGGSYTVLFLSMILSGGMELLPLRMLGYVGKNSFFFFTLTNFVPEIFSMIIQNESAVAKLGAYVVGAVIAWGLSEAMVVLKRNKTITKVKRCL